MNKNWPIPPVTTRFCFPSVSRQEAETEKRRNRKKGGRGTKGEAQREREREKESEEEKKESGGGTQRGKWCSKKPASTLDWNLKVPGSIPGLTLREIIHPKTTILKSQKNYVRITHSESDMYKYISIIWDSNNAMMILMRTNISTSQNLYPNNCQSWRSSAIWVFNNDEIILTKFKLFKIKSL